MQGDSTGELRAFASVFQALDCPAWANGKAVVLAVQRAEDPTDRKVIAMFPDEALWLHGQGRLEGWTPEEGS